MYSKRYIKIGTYAGNDIQLSNPEVHPFHAILMQDTRGKVYISLCDAGAKVLRNGSALQHTEELLADDSIEIGLSKLEIKDLFTWPQASPTLMPQQKSFEPISETADFKRKISLQLILIYAAVALLLILIAFYV